MSGNKNFPDGPFTPVLLDVVLRFSHLFEFSFFVLKPNGEFVEISIDKRQLLKTMEGYKARGMEEIYLREKDYLKFVTSLREYLDQKENFKAALVDMDLIYGNIRHQLLHVGMNGMTLRSAEDLNKIVIGQITKIPTLAQLLVEFKQNCPKEFLFYITLSYIATTMVDTFSWRSKQIKNKVGMASMLCDVLLTHEDFKTMREKPFENWPDKLKIYPVHNASKLAAADSTVPGEVIQMIEMHRELPEGNGFPRHLKHTAIPLLPSIFIVAYNFVDLLLKANMDPEKIEEIASKIYQDFSKGTFHQASLSIFETIGAQLPH